MKTQVLHVVFKFVVCLALLLSFTNGSVQVSAAITLPERLHPTTPVPNEPTPTEDEAFETTDLPPEALSLPADLTFGTRAYGNPKLDSTMADLAAAARVSTKEALDLAKSQSLRLSGNRVHVQIVVHAQGLQNVLEAVTKAGGEVTGVVNNDTLIQGWLPIDALEAVAAQKDVYLIRQPAEVVLLENLYAVNATTEGLDVINGPAWHTAGYRGAGVKVGIIDGGFEGYTDLLGTDLPASVTVKNFVDGENDNQVDGTTEHGTACTEIIYDIAPDATLYLAKVSTNADLAEAVTWLKDTHQVDIISTSLGWYNLTPGDGTGEFANLVQDARNAGILWATAASNDREAHWGGLYSDPDADNSHNFTADQEINYFGPGDGDAYMIPAGYQFIVFVRWDDWTDVTQDYDLYLVRWNGSSWEIIAASENYQDGSPGQTPTEAAIGTTTGADTAYGFLIRRYDSNRNVNFEIFAPKFLRPDEILHARSLGNLADAPDAMTVAALDVVSPYPQESYSSEGPTNGPGGAATGGFIKPDISGYANVSTESYRTTDKFNGTSAATPHVAGAAALALSANPTYTPDQLQSFLEQRAIDMGSAGMDTLFGHGRLYLDDPPGGSNTAPAISGLPDQTVPVNDSADNAIDLWAYASDAESTNDELTFTIDNAPDSGAGVSIDGDRYIDINPATDWTGQTDVVIRVTDPGGLSDTDTFGVTVIPSVDKTWNGDVSGDWHTTDNWTPPGVPTSGDDVLIPDVANTPVISSADAAVDSLIISTGAVLDLTDRALTVEGTLTNNGTLKQTQDVTVGSQTNFLRIANLAGNQTKYYGVDITPSEVSDVAVASSTSVDTATTLLSMPDQTLSMNATAATVLFYDGFESGSLGPEWTTYTTNDGQVQVSSGYPYSGTYSVILDDSVDDTTYSIAAIILTIDLSGQSEVELDFWWREFGDEDDPEDGVFISDDYGTNWYEVLSFNDGPTSYRNDVVDIDAAAAANGLILNDHFQIKFQFYDNYSITSDGYAVDEVYVQVPGISDIEVSPTSLEETVFAGEVVTRTLTISNTGTDPLVFAINEQEGGFTPPVVTLSTLESAYLVAPESSLVVNAAASMDGNASIDTVGVPSSVFPIGERKVSTLLAAGGTPVFATELINDDLVLFNTNDPAVLGNIGNIGSGSYYGGDFLGGDFTKMYAVDNYDSTFISIDTSTGVPTVIGSALLSSGHTWTGMAGDSTNDTLYGSSTDGSVSTLYAFDVATGASTVVGQITNAPAIIGIAVNAAGEMYGLDLSDSLVSIDKTTGAGTVIGPVGFNANYAQGMDFDEKTGILYLAAFNGDTLEAELRIADTSTGNSTLVGLFPGSTEIDALSIATTSGPGVVPWLSEEPGGGTVAVGGAVTVSVIFDATGLPQGDYTANLLIISNDPDENPLAVPVTMHVVTNMTNTPPSLSGLPDVTMTSGSAHVPIDLWDYADDAQDGDADLTFAIVNSPNPNAGVTLDDHYIHINPVAGWTGTTDVEVQVQDTGGLTDTDSFQVTVTDAVNTPPALSDLPDQTVPMNGSANNAIDLWAYADDVQSDDDKLTFTIDNVPDPDAGVRIDGNRYVDIFPATDWTGQTTVTVRVADPGGLFDTNSFQVTVTDTANTPPVLSDLPDQTVPMNGSANNAIDLWAYADDVESDDDDLTFTIDNVPDPDAGVRIDGNRYVDIFPATDWTGQTTIVVRVTDPGGLSDADTFQVTVTDMTNTPPVLSDLPDQTVPMNGSANNAIDLWAYASDAESNDDELIFTIDNTPDPDAGISIDSNRYVDIFPTTDWSGQTVVTIRVADPGGLFDTGGFQVTVADDITTTSVTVSVSGNQLCTGRNGVKRCFDIDPAAALDATVRFYFSEAERNDLALGDLRVFHNNGGWTEEPGPYDRGGTGDAQYVEAEGIDDFSLFALDRCEGCAPSTYPVYLPLVSRRWPPIPYAPVLNTISNSDGDGDYTVSWSSVDLADTYTLQEDNNASFASPTAYNRTSTSWSASGKSPGTYYYRVKAINNWESQQLESGWSNVRSVRVLPPPPPPQIYASADTTILQGYPTLNFCDTSDMWAGYDDYLSPDGKIVRSLIKFDTSSIPPGTAINQATLNVRLYDYWDFPNRSRTITAYRVGSSWSSCSTTWNNQPTIAEAYGSQSVAQNVGSWYAFDVTNLVRGWVNGSFANYGIWLRGPEASGSDSSWRSFYTMNTTSDPYLSITYSGLSGLESRAVFERETDALATTFMVIEKLNTSLPANSCQSSPVSDQKCLNALP